ncbi:MarR family transcriptional regulator [Catellatospora sp. TT07R-123]|uniref:MarR family winged helix-turn-helix transcriptional regulator n=1 Tax=Catellatospora sp. TT07R-123 TaxID=2733863 RepID=UPI001AFF93B7|nr:MarR family winged helix-turn-helix transcriptional regulator [Catellatospora sp. TT07R-123]GHJ44157.1 MarR family transcriptional regulator [Catellatospora sp. TT07R-123]
MAPVKPSSPLGTASFRLGVLGAILTEAYGELIDGLRLKHKHVGTLAVLDALGPLSQQELARTLRVAPSLVVTLADHLEGLGAIARERDAADRRRQVLTLTDEGRRLLAECAGLAAGLDAEFLSGLTAVQRAGLDTALDRLAARHLDIGGA